MIEVLPILKPQSAFVLDGCKNGWILSAYSKESFQVSFIKNLKELQPLPKALIYIDIPLKLPKNWTEYPRKSDQLAKQYLKRFHSSIFYAPFETWLSLPYEHINESCTQQNKPKVSKQSFNLFQKIKEATLFKKSSHHSLIEIHPELLIHHFLNSEKVSKKTKAGIEQRCILFSQISENNLCPEELAKIEMKLKKIFPHAFFQQDDILDCVLSLAIIEFLKKTLENSKKIDFEALKHKLYLFHS